MALPVFWQGHSPKWAVITQVSRTEMEEAQA